MNEVVKKQPAVKLSSKDWFGKVSAAVLLGFPLSLGLSGILGLFVFGGVGLFSIGHQLTMWSMSPTMLLILSFCFFFQNGLRAWLWLGFANLVVWGVLLTTAYL